MLTKKFHIIPPEKCHPALQRSLEVALAMALVYFTVGAVHDAGNLRIQELNHDISASKLTVYDPMPFPVIDWQQVRERERQRITTRTRVGNYTIELTTDGSTFPINLKIADATGTAFELKDFDFARISSLNYDEGKRLESADDIAQDAVRDITGDSVPEFAFSFYNGGWHCCFNARVFSLGETLQELTGMTDSEVEPRLEDLDGDRIPEIITSDAVFAYWHVPGNCSPQPRVVLQYRPATKRYEIAAALMRKTDLSSKENSTTTGWTSEDWDSVQLRRFGPPDDWYSLSPFHYAIDLIYAGRTAEAVAYIDKVWMDNTEFESKAAFWREFRETLESSFIYDDLVASGIIDLTALP